MNTSGHGVMCIGNVLKAASMTLISVAVVSRPVNAHQSLTTSPAPTTSEPRLTVPALFGYHQLVSQCDGGQKHILLVEPATNC